ncbi:hypothetical protein [Corallibacter sp.]|uniref:hypothetical protein n=1 Tax=Corallibacter sp. TaxID=2038084 RepID=UPI003AB42F88
MGGEGSMMAANNSLKNNRSLVAKRKEANALSGSYASVQMKEFPKATPEMLETIKVKLQKERKQRLIKQVVVCSIIIILIMISCIVFG